MQDTSVISLLQKYIKNQCTEDELRTLLQWLKKPDDSVSLDWVIKPLWDTIDKNMILPDCERENELQKEVSLLLSNMKRKELNSADSILKVRKKKYLNVFYRAAAIVVLVLSVTLGLLKVTEQAQETITYTEKISNKGETKSIFLADGTKVILNSDTKLTIPSDFNQEERIIEMEGEGFFDVTPNPDKPFIIKSGEAQVKVLGTSFDFKSYKEDDFIKLTVSTGKVRVNVVNQDMQLSVSPNEHLSVNKVDGTVSKEAIRENNYIKWIQGSLYFNKEPIREVIKTINRTYNRKVVLQCKGSCDYKITGTHDNKNIEAVIEAICFTTGLCSRLEGDNIIIYDKL
ncbi:FecR family protein [Parabacteroides chongii]|uniref:FecR family protein n=1 Tax=Parabacteroides chongii TaxID=2685834 RepID=UPI00240E1C53|nr:FecR domain-containing protein [Parabacteroides chongii]WFE84557.1 FecR domain-containing protein [Parabacteroides chongii]